MSTTTQKISREDLLKSLEGVEPGLSKKAITEQSDCLILGGGRVQTFNDEVYCNGPCSLNGDVAGAVPATKLLEIMRKLEQEELEVTLGGGTLAFKGKGGERFKVRLEAEVSLPVGEVEKPTGWKPLHPDFCEAVAAVGPCASRDQSRFSLTCVHLHPKWCEALDDMQLARWRLPTGLTAPVLVRQSSVRHLKQLGVTEFAEGSGWLHFRTRKGGLRLSCRHYNDEFPDLDEILKKLTDGIPAQLPKGLAEAADKAAVFSSENQDANLVRVVLLPGRVRVKGLGLSGEYTKPLKAKYDGPRTEFLMPPQILGELCKNHNEITVGEGRVWVKAGKLLYLACTVLPDDNINPAQEDTPVAEGE